jgi:hypothetical protein
MDKTLSKVSSLYGKTVAENFTDRITGRTGEQAQRKAAANTVKQFALLRYGPNAKVAWSQRLGCNCGCSPGWKIFVPKADYTDPNWEAKRRVFHEDDAWLGEKESSGRRKWKTSGPMDFYLEDDDKGQFEIRTGLRDGDEQVFPLPFVTHLGM